MWSILHNVHLREDNLAILLVACVTRDRENTAAENTARLAGSVPPYQLEKTQR